MKNTKATTVRSLSGRILTSLLTIMVAAPSFAQSPQQTQTTTAAKKPAAPAAQDESGFSLSIMSLADFKQKAESSIHYSEFGVGYTFNDKVEASLGAILTGPLHPKPGQQPELSDVELGFDFTIPLTEEGAQNSWTLLTGVAADAPTSSESIKNDMLMAFGAKAGLQLKTGKWTIKQMNLGYVYSYRYAAPATQVVYADDAASGWVGDFTGDETAPAPIEAPSYTYIFTDNRLSISRSITSNFSIKGEGIYQTTTSGTKIPDQNGRVQAIMTYSWLKQLKTFGGVFTATALGKENAPALFTEKTVGSRIGFVLSI